MYEFIFKPLGKGFSKLNMTVLSIYISNSGDFTLRYIQSHYSSINNRQLFEFVFSYRFSVSKKQVNRLFYFSLRSVGPAHYMHVWPIEPGRGCLHRLGMFESSYSSHRDAGRCKHHSTITIYNQHSSGYRAALTSCS